MNALDRHARKQVLLTRIAFERIGLRRDLAQLGHAVRLPRMLRAWLGGGFGRSLFGVGTATRASGAFDSVLALLRRYRLAAALLGGLVPVLRGRAGWPRLARLGVLAAAAWLGWRATQRRRGR